MTTIQFSTGQAFDLPEPVDPSAEHQLALTIRNNPLARHLAPVLQGSLDIWAEMRVPVNDFHAVLTSIVVACDANPDATVSVEGFELPDPDPDPDDVIYEDLAAMQRAGLRSAATLDSIPLEVQAAALDDIMEQAQERLNNLPDVEVTLSGTYGPGRDSIRRHLRTWGCDLTTPPYVAQAEQLVRAMVIGPDDVLVIAVPVMSAEQFDATVTRLNAGPLAGRIVLVEGAEQIVKMQGRDGDTE